MIYQILFDCIGPSTKFANFQRTSSVHSNKMVLHSFSIVKNFFAFFARVFLQTFMNVRIVTDQNNFTRKWLCTNIAVISIKKGDKIRVILDLVMTVFSFRFHGILVSAKIWLKTLFYLCFQLLATIGYWSSFIFEIRMFLTYFYFHEPGINDWIIGHFWKMFCCIFCMKIYLVLHEL